MNATELLMQMHLSLFNCLYFLFLAHLGVTYHRPYGAFFTYLSYTCIFLLCNCSLGGEWPLTPLGNSLLLRSELISIYE